MVTVRQALSTCTANLREVSPTPALDAEVLLRHALGWSREDLYSRSTSVLPPDVLQRFYEMVDQRMTGKPVAYITGHREFFGLDLLVDERVLVPRPETEVLVEAVLRWLGDACKDTPCLAADVGTGSGAIAMALLAKLPDFRVYAIDISSEALAVARANCQRLHLCDRLTLLEGDLLQPLPEPVDAVVANLPYAVPGEVDPNVDRWEPDRALYGGEDGMDLIARLIDQAPGKLREGGFLALEIHPPRIDRVLALADRKLHPARTEVVKDLAGDERVVLFFL